MEIIKEPNMQTVCQQCGCEFKFTKEDVEERGGSARKHVVKHYLGVNCPVCNKVIEVWKKEGEK